MQYGHSAGRGDFADRIEQRIVRSTAGGELDADHTRIQASLKLSAGVRTEVRIDDAVPADTIRLGALKTQKAVVAVLDVCGRWKVDRRGESPASQDRSDVDRDADSLARPQPTGISFLPVATGRTVVQKMGVYVDQRPYVSSSSRPFRSSVRAFADS
jgi:Arc/MetJ family transcription regulator